MKIGKKNSRRSFIKKSAAAAVGIAIVPRFVLVMVMFHPVINLISPLSVAVEKAIAMR